MAIYHLEAKIVSRGAGRSAIAAAAYLSCSRMLNEYDGVQHDYTRKQGLGWRQVFLPATAPAEWQDRENLWNAVEETETTKDSRRAREFVAALPKLRTADNAEMAESLSKMFPYDTDIKLAYLLASFESGEYDKACIKGTEFLAEDIFNPDYYDIVKKCGAEGFPNEDLVKKADLFKKVRGRIKAEKYNSVLEREAEKFYAEYPQDANAGLLLAEVKFTGG